MNNAQIKHMVDRFLGWKLPETFNPDGGIVFMKIANEGTAFASKREPTGTNLLDASQAEEMVRYILDGLPDPIHSVPAAAPEAENPVPAPHHPHLQDMQIASDFDKEYFDALAASSPAPVAAAVSHYISEIRPNPGNPSAATCSECGALLVCLSCGNHRDEVRAEPVSEPLPCPFCGSAARVYDNANAGRPLWIAECGNQECALWPSTNGCDTREEAIAKWNTRTR